MSVADDKMYFAVLISTFSLIFVGSCMFGWFDKEVIVADNLSGHARWVGIPTAPFEAASSDTTFSLTKLKAIIVDAAYQDAVDTTGETLIPPTLKSFADTFSEDLQSTLGLHVPVEIGHDCSENSIFLTIGSSSRFIDAAGRFTAEGYSILTEESSITVTGASSLGAWWATRTILQHAALNRLEIEQGSVVDAPAWRNRGVMVSSLCKMIGDLWLRTTSSILDVTTTSHHFSLNCALTCLFSSRTCSIFI